MNCPLEKGGRLLTGRLGGFSRSSHLNRPHEKGGRLPTGRKKKNL